MVKKRVKRTKTTRKISRKLSSNKISKSSRNFDNTPINKIPVSLKIISILFYIVGVLAIAFGVFFVVAGFMAPSLMDSLGTPEEIVQKIAQTDPNIKISVDDISTIISMLPVLFAVAGVVLIALGILYVFIGRGLINRKQWAKVLAILFVALGIIRSIFAIFGGRILSGIIWLAIFIILEYYIAFDEKSKKFFK
ncbi:hypothetical protein COX97_02570 [Candidatus Pacearchaeota archaeon CG_4_10_14_0_2_um_filter_05_32_18]|nr:MAG: hypothetical protein COX97_02570 [Candidatus Pacearchaeota archaeon CG_4_10_14_0_2_um_filter_05_32_18]